MSYKGEPIDSPEMGQIPDPWSISCDSFGDFIPHDKVVKMPHTEQIMVTKLLLDYSVDKTKINNFM